MVVVVVLAAAEVKLLFSCLLCIIITCSMMPGLPIVALNAAGAKGAEGALDDAASSPSLKANARKNPVALGFLLRVQTQGLGERERGRKERALLSLESPREFFFSVLGPTAAEDTNNRRVGNGRRKRLFLSPASVLSACPPLLLFLLFPYSFLHRGDEPTLPVCRTKVRCDSTRSGWEFLFLRLRSTSSSRVMTTTTTKKKKKATTKFRSRHRMFRLPFLLLVLALSFCVASAVRSFVRSFDDGDGGTERKREPASSLAAL